MFNIYILFVKRYNTLRNLTKIDINTLNFLKEIRAADLLIIEETSLATYLSAYLIEYFEDKHIALVNKDIIIKKY